jgi:hypothetical protein
MDEQDGDTMTWLRIDDAMLDHRKFERLYDACDEPLLHAAMHLWLVAGIHSARNLLDGVVGKAKIRTLAGMSRDVFAEASAALVHEGLLEAVEGDESVLKIHDFTEYNPSRQQVEARRAKDAVRKMSARTPSGHDAESARNPRLPDPDPDPVPIPNLTHTRTRAHESKDQDEDGGPRRSPSPPEPTPITGDADRDAVVAALRAHPEFRPLQVERAADAVMKVRLGRLVPIEWLVASVHEAANEIASRESGLPAGVSLSTDERSSILGIFARRAKAPPGAIGPPARSGQPGGPRNQAELESEQERKRIERSKVKRDLEAQFAARKVDDSKRAPKDLVRQQMQELNGILGTIGNGPKATGTGGET